MNPATIHLTCEHCSRPVTGTTGAVRVYDEDLAAAEAAHAAHAAAHEAAVAILSPLRLDGAADGLLRAPAPARWRTEHDRCAPHRRARLRHPGVPALLHEGRARRDDHPHVRAVDRAHGLDGVRSPSLPRPRPLAHGGREVSGGHDRLLRKLEEIQRQAPQAIPCRGSNSTAWITGTPQDTWYAQAHCQSCPARIACASYAVDAREPAGVWGGTTPTERAGLATQRRRSEFTAKEAS